MEDISKALVYEIKQDLANRYFGFRKQIETESRQYLNKLHNVDGQYTADIVRNMQRLRCLIPNEQLFEAFMQFTKIPESIGKLSTDQNSPAEWQRLFNGLRGKGFTRRRRFRNLLYQVFRLLAADVETYRKIYLELEEEHEDIRKEIERFYRMNDLSGILNFLREIDNPDSMNAGLLHSDRPVLAGQRLEEELRIQPPPAVGTHLPDLPQLPRLEAARPTLEELATQAYAAFDFAHIGKLPF